MTQARDKNYIEQTSDSLISIALSYFDGKNDPLRKAQAFFYAGQVQRDMKNDQGAAEYYIQARDEILKTTDSRFACLICSNLGMLYAYRPELKEEAKAFLREANQFALQANDSNYIANSFLELGRIYSVYQQWDSVIYYYEKAIRIAEEGKQIRSLSLALTEVASLYTWSGENEKASSYLHRTINLKEQHAYSGIEQTYLSLGNIYVSENRYDSAIVYLEKALQSTNPYTRRDAYWYLAKVNRQNNYLDKALLYNDKYVVYADSLTERKQAKEILEIKEKYEHEKLANENNQLKMQYDKWVKISLLVLLIVALIVASLIYLYQRKLLYKERTLQQTKNKILILFETIDKNNTIIESNKELIRNLSSKVKETEDNKIRAIENLVFANETLRDENLKLKDSIADYNNSLRKREEDSASKQLTKQINKLLSREKRLIEQLEEKTSIFNEIRQTEKVMSKQQWQNLSTNLNQLHTNFTERLSKQYPQLNEMDIQYCCFMKLNLSNDQIGTLVAVSPQSVIKRKQRIRDKMNTNPEIQFPTVQTLIDYLSHY